MKRGKLSDPSRNLDISHLWLALGSLVPCRSARMPTRRCVELLCCYLFSQAVDRCWSEERWELRVESRRWLVAVEGCDEAAARLIAGLISLCCCSRQGGLTIASKTPWSSWSDAHKASRGFGALRHPSGDECRVRSMLHSTWGESRKGLHAPMQ